MSLVPSLLQAIVRVDGEALVMHVGEKPYVVSPNGQIDLATRGLTFDAVNGLVAQLLSADAMRSLEDVGATQYELPPSDDFPGERFTVTAARGGDDVWAEIRRRVSHDDELAPADLFPSLAPSVSPALAATASATDPQDDDLMLPQEGQLWPDAPRAEVARQPEVSDDDLRLDVPDLTVSASTPPPALPVVQAVPPPVAAIHVEPFAAPAAAVARPTEPEPAEVSVPELATALVEEHVPEPAAVSEAEPAATIEPQPNQSQKAIASWLANFSSAISSQRTETVRAAESPESAVVVPSVPVEPPAPLEMSAPPAAVEVEAVEALEPPVAAPLVVVPVAEVVPTPPVVATPPVVVSAPVVAPPPPVVAAAQPVAPAALRPVVPSATPVLPADQVSVAPPMPAPAPVLVKPSFAVNRESEPEMSTTQDFAPLPALTEQPQSAVVLPIARSARDTMTSESSAAPLERLLRLAASRGATALFLSAGSKPSVRVDGDVQLLDGTAVLGAQDIESLLLGAAVDRSGQAAQGESAEWVWELAELGSVRCSSFRDHRGPGAVFRIVAVRPQSAAQLGLAREIQALAGESEGLVLVSGPRASGKSTLISSLVDVINRTRRDYVITLESEVNVVHERMGAFISQREVRGGSDELVAAARAALREHPDVLVIDDLRTSAVMSVALDAAASGQLVIGGVPAHHASGAVERLIDLYHPEHRRQMQLSFAQNLRGVVSQVLLRKSGGGRVAAREILLNTPIVSSLLAEGRVAQLPVAIEGGRKSGMVPLNDALVGFVQSGAVDVREAYRRAVDRAGFIDLLKRQGIDTSFAERLA